MVFNIVHVPVHVRPTGTVVCIPDQPPSGLMPPAGLLHKSFPVLVLSEYSERQGGKRRKTAVSRQKRPSVGRRRAISELMVRPYIVVPIS